MSVRPDRTHQIERGITETGSRARRGAARRFALVSVQTNRDRSFQAEAQATGTKGYVEGMPTESVPTCPQCSGPLEAGTMALRHREEDDRRICRVVCLSLPGSDGWLTSTTTGKGIHQRL